MNQDLIVEVPEMIGEGLGLYDNRHPDEPSVVALKVVDITALSTNASNEKALLLYANTVRGMLVQARDCYPNEDFGMSIHFYPYENTATTRETVNRVAAWFGIDRDDMQTIIFNHAPKVVNN